MAEQLVPLLGIIDRDTEALTGLTYAGGGADRYPAPVSGAWKSTLIARRYGSIATPLATLTLAATSGQFTLPVSIEKKD